MSELQWFSGNSWILITRNVFLGSVFNAKIHTPICYVGNEVKSKEVAVCA